MLVRTTRFSTEVIFKQNYLLLHLTLVGFSHQIFLSRGILDPEENIPPKSQPARATAALESHRVFFQKVGRALALEQVQFPTRAKKKKEKRRERWSPPERTPVIGISCRDRETANEFGRVHIVATEERGATEVLTQAIESLAVCAFRKMMKSGLSLAISQFKVELKSSWFRRQRRCLSK